jgi:hypothetical protein
MLPVIDEVTDIDTCIRYFSIIGGGIECKMDFEGFLYLKTDNYADIIEEDLKRHRAIYEHNVKLQRHGYTQEELERRVQRHEEVKKREIAPIEEILTNPKLNAEYNEKLECRKAANIEKLRSYGLNV